MKLQTRLTRLRIQLGRLGRLSRMERPGSFFAMVVLAVLLLSNILVSCGDHQAPGETKAAASSDGETSEASETESGLIYTELKAGTGASPKRNDKVRVHYHGTLEDGRVFDSSVARRRPASFRLNRVIKCWTEGLQMMKVGGKAKLVCPPELAYGKRGRPPKIPANSTLVFEVELLAIE